MNSYRNLGPLSKKPLNGFISLLLTAAMLLSLYACAKPEAEPTTTTSEQVEEVQEVFVEREAEPEALQKANEATALALRYYIYARLKTEELTAADFESMPKGQFEAMLTELVSIWETADLLTSAAESVTGQVVFLLENQLTNLTAPSIQRAAHVQPKDLIFLETPPADGGGAVVDQQTWAENLTKQYDALRGGQRYHQLAQQLGTDTKTAVEKMAMAQKIIQNAAALEEAEAEVGAYTRSINIVEGYKTTSKVGLFVGATIATGGGTLATLAGSSMSLPVAGAVIVGGVDCIVDVGTTASSIILGEDHQVTVDFAKAGDVIQPISMVMGLATMDPSDAIEQVAFLGEAMMEWSDPGKITGIAVDFSKKGTSIIWARLIELAKASIPDVKMQLEGMKLSLPKEEGVDLSELILANTVDAQAALERLRELIGQEPDVAQDNDGLGPEPEEAEPAEEDPGTLTGEQPPETTTGALTPQAMAGNYSGVAVLQFLAEDVEGDDSLDLTLQLNESGTGVVNVGGYGGQASVAGAKVTFSVASDGASIQGEGWASANGGQITISGSMSVVFMGVIIASYSWTATK